MPTKEAKLNPRHKVIKLVMGLRVVVLSVVKLQRMLSPVCK
uniref:Uncharacterized protein n=1 Tax=Arundo donax TaxID=35708 RepID=A0A0A8YIB1_ARUDO